MDTFIRRCRCFLLFAAALFVAPALSRAADPVEQLRDALKIDIGGVEPDLKLAARRNKMIETIMPELKSVAQLRRAYFLKQWGQTLKDDKPNPVLDVERYRTQIGEKLIKAIRANAAADNVVAKLAVGTMIAEIADSEPIDSRGKEKFTRSLTDVASALARDKNLAVRQVGVHALGKITPDPAEVFPVLMETLKKDELGPRRLAAYALTSLVKNARALPRAQKLKTLEEVLATAGQAQSDADEPVRGYGLQAIESTAKLIGEQFASAEELTDENKDKDNKTTGTRTPMKADVQQVFRAFQKVNPQIAQALYDPKLNVRLAGMVALDQIGAARAKILTALQEITPDKRERQVELMKIYQMPDPLGPIVAKLSRISDLLQEDDVRLRRGAIDFLESLGELAEPAADDVTQALRDSDRMVRWSAARALRNLPPAKVSAEAIRRLGTMLIDPDPDLSAAAAATLEALGPAAHDAVDWLAFVIANGDSDARTWDVENRQAAMRALASIGGASAHRAIPQLTTALRDEDVRIRRDAAYTLGRLGPPADASSVEQALQALQRALSDDDSEVRLNAAEAILSVRK